MEQADNDYLDGSICHKKYFLSESEMRTRDVDKERKKLGGFISMEDDDNEQR